MGTSENPLSPRERARVRGKGRSNTRIIRNRLCPRNCRRRLLRSGNGFGGRLVAGALGPEDEDTQGWEDELG